MTPHRPTSPSTPSIYSGSTACSYRKDPPPRRGLRQKARDVVSDLGAPPTTRQDAKDGKRALDCYAVDAALMAGSLSVPVKI